MKKLTQRETLAVNHYIKHGNKTEAYAAGYSVKNMKRTTIARRSAEVFERPHVKAKVTKLQKKAEDEAVLTKKEALLILTRQARGQLGDYLDEENQLDLDKVKADKGVISELSFTKFGPKLKLYDSTQAITNLAKLCGWNKEQHNEAVQITLNMGGK